MYLFSEDPYGDKNYKDFINSITRDQSSSRTICSFFSGCGGLDLGLHWAGFELAFANEIDKNAAATFEHNLGKDVCRTSISELHADKVPDADLFVGGFPCQPFSYSGLRKGLEDTRGTLFFDFARIISEKRPTAILIENVAGFAKHDKGRTLQTVLRVLEDIGYKTKHTVLNAEDFGVPQTRRRTFIFGTLKSNDIRKFAFPQSFASGCGVKEAIDDLVEATDVLNNEPMQHRARIIERFSKIPPGGTWRDVPEDHRPRLRGDPTKISHKNMRLQSHQRLDPKKPCYTITANIQTHFIHYSQDRNLTPREAARLQSFPDDYFFVGKRSFMSWDTELSQYQQIGNAVPPLLGRAIGRQIKLFLDAVK